MYRSMDTCNLSSSSKNLYFFRFSTPTDEAGKVREPWTEWQSIEQQHLINSEWAFIPQVFGSIGYYVDRIRYNTQFLPKCFTWRSLNYIVSLSRKMRTLYQEKRHLEWGPRGIYFILILALLCQKCCNI